MQSGSDFPEMHGLKFNLQNNGQGKTKIGEWIRTSFEMLS